ncbi:hypothetical protein VTK56DRAFT_2311 [Thermocarpiscus australiensis]
MRDPNIGAAVLQLLSLGSAQKYEFFRWNTPGSNLAAHDAYRRQTPPPGYHPEFGSCGSGTTCEDACGPNWLSCEASTTLSLFCYNKVDLNQTCCANGSGRACDNGYYCAWQEFGGRVWCCENGQSLEECGVPSGSSTTASTGGPSSSLSSASEAQSSATVTTTSRAPTGSELSSTIDSHYPASTVTSWATTTVISTVSFAVTVTAPSQGCSLTSGSSSGGTPSGSSSVSNTITEGPPSSTSQRPPFNTTRTTSTLVTAGADGLSANPVSLGLVVLGMLWIWVTF